MTSTHGRTIAFGGYEHQQREIYATHFHRDGARQIWGNGSTILVVLRPTHGAVTCQVWGPDGFDYMGAPFCYSDYFLVEDVIA